MDEKRNNTWSKWGEAVLENIARLVEQGKEQWSQLQSLRGDFAQLHEQVALLEQETRDLPELRKAVQELQRAVDRLEQKAGVWGLIGGVLGALVPISLIVLKWLIEKK